MSEDPVIRLMAAGSAVGTRSFPMRRNIIHELDDSSVPSLPSVQARPGRSDKQRPSRRKLRRWNNDKFAGVAAELAKAGHIRIAEEFSRGEAEQSYYERANDPRVYKSVFADICSSRIDENGEDENKDAKEMFLEGNIFVEEPVKLNQRSLSNNESALLNGDELFQRVNPRLRQVTARMICGKSSSAENLIDSYESFLISTFQNRNNDFGKVKLLHDYLDNEPRIFHGKNGIEVKFYFEIESPSSGLNRLLLHAVCQFHCLHATSNALNSRRVVTVSGKICGEEYQYNIYALRSLGVTKVGVVSEHYSQDNSCDLADSFTSLKVN